MSTEAKAAQHYSWQFDPLGLTDRVEIMFDGVSIAEVQSLKGAHRMCQLLNTQSELLNALNDVLALIHKAGLPWNKSRVLTRARTAIAKATQP